LRYFYKIEIYCEHQEKQQMVVELQFRTLLNGQTFGTGTFSYNGQYAPVTILHQGDLISFTYQDEIVGAFDLSHLANFDFVYQSVDNICAFNIIVASADRTRSLTAGPAQPHLTRPGTSADVAKPRSQVVELEWPTPKTSPLTPPPPPLFGQFDVISTSEIGYNFTNPWGWDMTFTFTPSALLYGRRMSRFSLSTIHGLSSTNLLCTVSN
jgi:hypothetical protein